MRGRRRLPLAHRAEDAESDCGYKVGAGYGICDGGIFAGSSTLTIVFIIPVFLSVRITSVRTFTAALAV